MLIDQLIDEITASRKRLEEKGKQAFMEYATSLFDQYPQIQDFRWAQYTPYFNDGDACVFGVGEVSGRLTSGESLGEDYYFDDEDEDAPVDTISQEDKAKLEKVLSEFATKINKLDDVMENIFGDHVTVIVSREDVQIEEYDHD